MTRSTSLAVTDGGGGHRPSDRGRALPLAQLCIDGVRRRDEDDILEGARLRVTQLRHNTSGWRRRWQKLCFSATVEQGEGRRGGALVRCSLAFLAWWRRIPAAVTQSMSARGDGKRDLLVLGEAQAALGRRRERCVGRGERDLSALGVLGKA